MIWGVISRVHSYDVICLANKESMLYSLTLPLGADVAVVLSLSPLILQLAMHRSQTLTQHC